VKLAKVLVHMLEPLKDSLKELWLDQLLAEKLAKVLAQTLEPLKELWLVHLMLDSA
jgi:hypothetical protein